MRTLFGGRCGASHVLAVGALAMLASSVAVGQSPGFGTASESVLLIGSEQFQLVQGNEDIVDLGTMSRTCFDTCVFVATPTLPTGAILTSLEVEGCDGDATGYFEFGLYAAVPPVGFVQPASTVAQSLGTPGCEMLSVDLSRTVYNEAERLIVGVDLVHGTNVKFAAARVHYKRVVSPPPAVAMFGDVPTNHPFFQYVEALAASGITAGCGSGNFCPDQPLTRGQMAVFLSKALGLHFPD